MHKLTYLLVLAGVVGCTTVLQTRKTSTSPVAADDLRFSGGDFDEHIRQSNPRSPDDERTAFVLAPGFRIELFAAEPLISKPLNMAFDAKGRLWVTQSTEYPFAAKPGQSHDRITILEDKDHDGRAETATTVLDTLNIPIGALPIHDGLLAFSIPYLHRFTDTNGDDKMDGDKVLLGPFGRTDTHGLVNHLTRGFDGWIQACHGFTNLSKIVGADGDSAKLESGCTFRFRPDGSRVELTAKGRVNPFGLVYDRWGYLYSPDSHSSPLTQLIRGAEYPHFGRIAEGIGFGPAMKEHEMEATALAGIALPSSHLFPEAYQKSIYIGDVVKCRIYRNSYTFNGSSPVAKHEADFLRSADPWFRPVDIVEGPDGALYVADFYNRIIGHYEVPLDNPGRDRQRGRIWRITYEGKTDPAGRTDWTKADVPALLDALAVGNLPVRFLILDQLVNRVGQPAVEPLLRVLTHAKNPDQYVHSLWALHRLGALPEAVLTQALHHKQALIRTHALRVLHDAPARSEARFAAAMAGLGDVSPHVQRAAAEALTDYPRLESVQALVARLPRLDSADTHLIYTANLALQTLLRNKPPSGTPPGGVPLGSTVATASWSAGQRAVLATPMSGVKEAYAAQFLLQTIRTAKLTPETEVKLLSHTARYLPAPELDELVTFIRQKYGRALTEQYTLFKLVQQAVKKKAMPMSTLTKSWGTELARRLVAQPSGMWSYQLAESPYLRDNPVALGPPPPLARLAKTLSFIGLDQGGFKGIVRSPVFTAPSSLTFSAFQQNETQMPGGGHVVRLVLATDTTQVLACTEFAKSHDYQAEVVSWDLRHVAGKPVRLELVDFTNGIIRVGNFQGLPVNLLPNTGPKDIDEQRRFGLELAGELGITSMEPLLNQTMLDKTAPSYFRVASAKALMKLAPERYVTTLIRYIEDEKNPTPFRLDLATSLGDSPHPLTQAVMEAALKHTKGEVQLELLKALAVSAMGKDLILSQVQAGKLYTRMLVQPGLEDRLLLNISKVQKERYTQLTANLSPIDEARETLIQTRLASFTAVGGSAVNGRVVFTTNCSSCHQIGKEGGLVGPQLDGIGSWGVKSLATKILDPNRNISEAFRLYTIRLKSGSVRSGLFRRDDEKSIIYADASGAEFVVPRNEIATIQASRHTLMPDHFGTSLPEKDVHDLLSYLLTVK